jgi:sporulation-control protein spo0M
MVNIVVNAKLSQIYPIADNNKHSVKVKFDLPENVPVLVGAYAEVEIFETDSGSLMGINVFVFFHQFLNMKMVF